MLRAWTAAHSLPKCVYYTTTSVRLGIMGAWPIDSYLLWMEVFLEVGKVVHSLEMCSLGDNLN